MENAPAPTQSANSNNRLIILALWLLLYASFTLFTPPLLDDADSVHAEVAREIFLRHDWVTLYANGIRYLEKAPLLYWSMAVSFKFFGVHTFAARIPLTLTILGLVFTLESFTRRAFQSSRAGLYAGLIILSSFGIFIFTRITIPDAAVCLRLTLALYAYWLTEQEDPPQTRVPHRRRSLIEAKVGIREANRLETSTNPLLCYTFAAACALNVLTKGLIGVVFPIAIVLFHLLLTRSIGGTIKRLRQLHLISSTAVFLIIAALWHILIALANPTQGNPSNLSFQHGHWQVPLRLRATSTAGSGSTSSTSISSATSTSAYPATTTPSPSTSSGDSLSSG
jgi:4-amino-4-deoxy-L-arabinose transferase-like glycosyltransferase